MDYEAGDYAAADANPADRLGSGSQAPTRYPKAIAGAAGPPRCGAPGSLQEDNTVTIQLPALVTAYFLAANRQDIDAMLVPFAAEAIVQDEGEEHVGHVAIRAWMVETTQKYRVTVEPQKSEDSNGRTTVAGLVSGNFPGSPAKLRYSFTLSSDGISRLAIG